MSRPTIINITGGIVLNLNNAATAEVARNMALTKPKEGLKGKPQSSDDFVSYDVDCVCFHYSNKESLFFRVGYEITPGDYDRLEETINFLTFRLYDRKPSTEKDTNGAT